jgi:hypothetical protein
MRLHRSLRARQFGCMEKAPRLGPQPPKKAGVRDGPSADLKGRQPPLFFAMLVCLCEQQANIRRSLSSTPITKPRLAL